MYAFLFSRTYITCSTHLNILYFMAILIFCKEYKSLSSSLCSFLFTSCLMVQILSSALVPENPQFVFLCHWERPCLTSMLNRRQNHECEHFRHNMFTKQTISLVLQLHNMFTKQTISLVLQLHNVFTKQTISLVLQLHNVFTKQTISLVLQLHNVFTKQTISLVLQLHNIFTKQTISLVLQLHNSFSLLEVQPRNRDLLLMWAAVYIGTCC
jgi:hypothetical protein